MPAVCHSATRRTPERWWSTPPILGMVIAAERRHPRPMTRSLAPVLVMAALIAPTAGADRAISIQDTRDVAEPSAPASCRHDLRSQDALDAARSLPPEQLAAVAEGLRSGSARIRR